MGFFDGFDLGSGVSYYMDPFDLTGYRSGQATQRAIDAQTNAANAANATQRYMYDTTRADNEPWRVAGGNAVAQLANGNILSNFTGDPGYQFRLSEGMKAINGSAAAKGMSNSGASLKALTRYGQDYASNEYNNAYNRQFNRLSTLAGYGQGANSQNGAAGSNYANNVSANQIGLGNAYANAAMAQSNRQGQMGQQLLSLGGMMALSDERVKKNISPIPKEDLSEMKKFLKAFYFNYIADEFGSGDWLGVMAQDLEKSKLGRFLVVEDENGFKKIDIRKVMSMFLATMAEA